MRAEPAIARAIGLLTRALRFFDIGVIGSLCRQSRPECLIFGFRQRTNF